VEGQLAAKGAEARAAQAEFRARLEAGDDEPRRIRVEMLKREARDEAWKAGALRFKTGLEERLGEARRVLHDLDDPLVNVAERITEERNRALVRVALLEQAIRRHRDTFPDEDDPSDADLELWQMVGR
jgi:hypothetical protein